MKYTIKEIKPNIFLILFSNHYDMCMQFLRYQEYYESPNPKFRNHQFTIIDYMRWYSKKYGDGSFTYPNDWSGFNFPSYIIPDLHNKMIHDRNIYDYEMLNIYKHCKKVSNDFYIIGATKTDKTTINHEIAHGFFYTDSKYRKTMKKLVAALPTEVRTTMNVRLKSSGYTKKVFIDEIQAYFATNDSFNDPSLEAHRSPFVAVFKQYNK